VKRKFSLRKRFHSSTKRWHKQEPAKTEPTPESLLWMPQATMRMNDDDDEEWKSAVEGRAVEWRDGRGV